MPSLPDMHLLIIFAIIGMVAILFLFLGGIGGLLWFIFNHIEIVW